MPSDFNKDDTLVADLPDFSSGNVATPDFSEGNTPDPTLGEKVKSALGAIPRGAVDVAASLPESIAIAARELDRRVLNLSGIPDDAPLSDRGLYQLGQMMRQKTEEAFPKDPRLADSFWAEQVPSGIGSTVGFIGTGGLLSGARNVAGRVLTRKIAETAAEKALQDTVLTGTGKALEFAAKAAPIAASGAMVNAVQGYKDALAKGADEDTAIASFVLNGVGGVAEAAPIQNILNRINRSTGGGISKAIRDILSSGAEELIQESGQQALGNVIAQNLYDHERKTLEGVAAAGGAGGVTGALLSLLGIGGKRLLRGGQAEQPAVEFQDPATGEWLSAEEYSAATQPPPLSPEGFRVLGGGRFESGDAPPADAINVSSVETGGKTTYTFRLPPKAVPPETKIVTPFIPAVRPEDFLEPTAPRPPVADYVEPGPTEKVVSAEDFQSAIVSRGRFRPAPVSPITGRPQTVTSAPTGARPATLTADQEYDASLATFKEASKAFTAIRESYRKREIGDDEFIAGKEAFDDAQTVADVAERKFIEAKNASAPPPVAKQSLTTETPGKKGDALDWYAEQLTALRDGTSVDTDISAQTVMTGRFAGLSSQRIYEDLMAVGVGKSEAVSAVKNSDLNFVPEDTAPTPMTLRVMADYKPSKTPVEVRGEAKAKEPWEMTKVEWTEHEKRGTWSDFTDPPLTEARAKESAAYSSIRDAEQKRKALGQVESIRKVMTDRDGALGRNQQRRDADKAAEQARLDYSKASRRVSNIQTHEGFVKRAIERGDISSHPDYPDLKPQVKAEAKPVTLEKNDFVIPESVEANELRITKEKRGLGRFNQERLDELEKKEAVDFENQAASEATRATEAWGKHSVEVVEPLRQQIRKLSQEVQEMAYDAKRTSPTTKGKQRLTKKAFLEKYGATSMDEANALYKTKNEAWSGKQSQLEAAEAKLKELEQAKEKRSKEWSRAVTRRKESELQAKQQADLPMSAAPQQGASTGISRETQSGRKTAFGSHDWTADSFPPGQAPTRRNGFLGVVTDGAVGGNWYVDISQVDHTEVGYRPHSSRFRYYNQTGVVAWITEPTESDRLAFGNWAAKNGVDSETVRHRGADYFPSLNTGIEGSTNEGNTANATDAAGVAVRLEQSGEVLWGKTSEITEVFARSGQSRVGQPRAGQLGGLATPRGVRAGEEAGSAEPVQKTRIFIPTDTATPAARQNSDILANRILYGSWGPSDSAVELLGHNAFGYALFAKLNKPRVIFRRLPSEAGRPAPVMRYDRIPEIGDFISINIDQIGNYDLSDPEQRAELDAALSEELLHTATMRLSSDEEIRAVWQSLSAKEQSEVRGIYPNVSNDFEGGAEYVRLVLQERLAGTVTEQHRWRITDEIKRVLQKLVNFLKQAFGAKPADNIARQVIERIESAIKGDTPIAGSVFGSGEVLRSGIERAAQEGNYDDDMAFSHQLNAQKLNGSIMERFVQLLKERNAPSGLQKYFSDLLDWHRVRDRLRSLEIETEPRLREIFFGDLGKRFSRGENETLTEFSDRRKAMPEYQAVYVPYKAKRDALEDIQRDITERFGEDRPGYATSMYDLLHIVEHAGDVISYPHYQGLNSQNQVKLANELGAEWYKLRGKGRESSVFDQSQSLGTSINRPTVESTTTSENETINSKAFRANAELADDLGTIRPEDDEEGVRTKVGNVYDQVLSRPGLNNAVKADSVANSQNALAEAGLVVAQADDGLFGLVDSTAPQEQGGQSLVAILEREIQSARAENRPERIANLLNTVVVHLARDKNQAFSQATKNRLYALAQGERSAFGRALGSLAMWGKVLASVAMNPSLHLNRIYSDNLGGEQISEVMRRLREILGGSPTEQEIEDALTKVQAEFSKKNRMFEKGNKLWGKIQKAARAGLFDPGPILEDLARNQGWTVPTEGQKAWLRARVAEEERLRTPTQRQIDNSGGDIDKATSEAAKGTESERLKIIKDIQAHWSRWSMPISWNPFKWTAQTRLNNARAVNEFVAANFLFTPGFPVRQWMDVVLTSLPLNAVNRTLVHVLERAQNDGGFSMDTTNDLYAASEEMLVSRIASLKATIRAMERTAGGHLNRKVLERMTHSVGVFERMRVKANELKANGNLAGYWALRFASILQAGYRVASVFDESQATGLEWQEMRQQLATDLRAQGKTRAEIVTQLDDILGGIRVDMVEAVAEVTAIKQERELPLDKKAIEQDAWALIKARAYDRMRQATGTDAQHEAENTQLRELHSWNLPETGGIGGAIAGTINFIKRYTEKAGIPTGGLFSFGNAMGIAANRMATFSGGGLFGGFGFGDSPWYQGERNVKQRRIEAIEGLAVMGLMVALAAAGKILIMTRYPDDKDEKERFIAEGHKLNTVRFIQDDGRWIEYPIQMSPFSFIASPLYMIGGIQRLLINQQKAQERLNAEAEKTGTTPGQAKAIGPGDVAGVIAQGMYGMLTGGRTATGAIQSFSDYGDFNLSRASSSLVRGYIPGVPAWQTVSRMMGVAMDSKTASVFEQLFPVPGSQHQRVNSLGDPMTNANDAVRVLQVLTAGVGFGSEADVKNDYAYRQLAAAGYAAPSIGRGKGYNFGGTVRPLTPKEYERYTVERGKAFKQELEQLGSLDGIGSVEARKAAQSAFQRANQRALASVGVSEIKPKRAYTRRLRTSGGITRRGRQPSLGRIRRGRTPSFGKLRPARAPRIKRTVLSGTRKQRVQRIVPANY